MYGLCVIQHSLNGQSTTFRSKCFRRTGKSGIVNEYTIFLSAYQSESFQCNILRLLIILHSKIVYAFVGMFDIKHIPLICVCMYLILVFSRNTSQQPKSAHLPRNGLLSRNSVGQKTVGTKSCSEQKNVTFYITHHDQQQRHSDGYIYSLLKKHERRTFNKSNADFIIVSISFYKRNTTELENQLRQLFASSEFKKRNGSNFLYFGYPWGSSGPKDKRLRSIMAKGMQTSHYLNEYTLSASPIVIPYETWLGKDIITPNYTSWKSRNIHVFYRTRETRSWGCKKIDKIHGKCAGSMHGFRHIPLNASSSYKNSSIGHGLQGDVWGRSWSNSRFCLSLRGDDPLSHAFGHAVSQGCIPVITHTYVWGGSPFQTIQFEQYRIKLEDMSVVIPESIMYAHSENIYNYLMSIPKHIIEKKLDTMRRYQPFMLYTMKKTKTADLLLESMCEYSKFYSTS